MKLLQIKDIILKALDSLSLKDDDIFKLKTPKFPNKNAENKATEIEKLLNRELHETTLNHRFAYYLETELLKENITCYCVDIEYNRNFGNSKTTLVKSNHIPIRPDILIHKRMSKDKDRHLLAVEAKKGKSTEHDIDKIKGLMLDSEYLYDYGLTISYSYDQNKITGILYFKEPDGKILEEQISVKRKNSR